MSIELMRRSLSPSNILRQRRASKAESDFHFNLRLRISRAQLDIDGRRSRGDQVCAGTALGQLQPGQHVSPALYNEMRKLTESPRSCISTGTRKGYSITNCDPFGKVYGKGASLPPSYRRFPTDPNSKLDSADGATSIVEMLFCTSLVALVGAGERPASSTRRLQIVNTKRQSTICELTFPTTILAVKLNRRRLVVVLEQRIYLYDISNMKLLHEIETNMNSNGAFFVRIACHRIRLTLSLIM